MTLRASFEDRDVCVGHLEEGWFFYWKTSASLWEAKLAMFGNGPILVPLYWGHHYVSPNHYDFGNLRPEANLGRLLEVAAQMGREVAFVLPLGPIPFLPNGGLPAELSRIPQVDSSGLNMASLDGFGAVNKFFSFFHPKVHSEFRKFLWNLNCFLQAGHLDVDIVGPLSHYFQWQQLRSFFDDHSMAFEKGLHRFLKLLMSEGTGEVEDQESARGQYIETILGLYRQSAQELLKDYWAGEVNICFIGSGPLEGFRRGIAGPMDSQLVFNSLMDCTKFDCLPSGVMLGQGDQLETPQKAIGQHWIRSFLFKNLSVDLYEGQVEPDYLPLKFFDIHAPGGKGRAWAESPPYWEKQGLIRYLEVLYRGTFTYRQDLSYLYLEDAMGPRTHFFAGSGLDGESYSQVLKLFFAGANIIIDLKGLDGELSRALQSFFIENNLTVESLHYLVDIKVIKLGTAVMALYHSDQVVALTPYRMRSFWDHFGKVFAPDHIAIEASSNIYYQWLGRSARPSEIQFEEVRRLFLANPTHYRSKVKVPYGRKFSVLKCIDQKRARFGEGPLGPEIELFGEGTLMLDFGLIP